MKTRARSIRLEKGQIWKLADSHIEIVELGKSLTHYKRFQHRKQRGVPVKLERTEAVENYLKKNRAVLVEE